ncbi:DUF6233 domain-containing protein [Streptomyces sp. NP-1717]|uniref:DUF6233 domain-containing protein n=1 Tax=unclassified Streptomyces TaxID=2593676 RepID=UPI001F5DCDF8|nr:DUF6233 domain-containing protein [Streptomyces sp. NP-1717]MCI3221830.1 hypothetical protein [Streptomyces sp. NP-1717]WTA78000.1 DUF6233 domain-containing protein [Streptomyces sp. NBC_00838]
MSDSPEERLRALRFLRRVQARDLARTDRWIAVWEQRAAEWVRRQAKPAVPDWALQYGVGGRAARPAMVHTSQCWVPGAAMEGIGRDQAIEALTRGGVPPCVMCRPERELGLLD